MAYEYKDVQRCKEHDLALSAAGTCLRCARASADADRRARITRTGIAAAILTSLAGAALLCALLLPSPVEPPPQFVPANVVLGPRSTTLGLEPFGAGSSRSSRSSRVTSPATHAALQSWQEQLALAERQAEMQAAADRQASASAAAASRQSIWKNLGPTPLTPTWASVAPRPPAQTSSSFVTPPVRHVQLSGMAVLPHRHQAPPVDVPSPVALPQTAMQPPHDLRDNPPLPPAYPGGRLPSHLRRVVHPPHLDAPPPRPITEGSRFPDGTSL